MRLFDKSNQKDPHAGPISKDPGLKPGPLRSTILACATGLGSGYAPIAPGTAGTLLAIPLFWFLAPPYGAWYSYLGAAIAISALGILSASAAEGIFQKKDDGRVVIDEIAGYLVTMFLVWGPDWSLERRLWAAALGFLLFRVFDIVKPPPAHQLQSLPGGLGIVIDDLIAGVYACLSLHVLLYAWDTCFA